MLSIVLIIIRSLERRTPRLKNTEQNRWDEIHLENFYNNYIKTDKKTLKISTIYKLIRSPFYTHPYTGLVYDNSVENARKFGHLVPTESSRHHDLADFFLNKTGGLFLLHDRLSDKQHNVRNKHWIVDFSRFEKYNVDPQFYRYGGIVYLTENNGKAIITKYKYMGEYFEGTNILIEYIIRATLMVALIFEIHYMQIHYKIAQENAEKYSKYSKNLPLTDLLYLLTFDTVKTNRNLSILLDVGCLFDRLFAFTGTGYSILLNDCLRAHIMDFEGCKGTEWNRQIKAYKKKVYTLVSKIADKKSVDEITDFMTQVTAIHNQTGDVQIYSLLVDNFFLPKVYSAHPGFISNQDRDLLVSIVPNKDGPKISDEYLSKTIFRLQSHQSYWENFRLSISSKPEKEWFDPRYFEISVCK